MKLSILGIGGSLDKLSLTLLFWNLSVIYLSEKKSLITRIFRNWFHASHSSKIYRGNVVGIKYECLYKVLDLSQTGWKSSRRRCSVRKGVFKNFAKFTGKNLCQGLFFNKVAGLSQVTPFLQKTFGSCFWRWLTLVEVDANG